MNPLFNSHSLGDEYQQLKLHFKICYHKVVVGVLILELKLFILIGMFIISIIFCVSLVS